MSGIDWEAGKMTPPAAKPSMSSGPSAATDWEKGVMTPPPGSPSIGRRAADLGLSVAKGVIAVPEAAVGLADMVTGGQAGKVLENEGGALGFRPKQAKEYLSSLQSDDLKAKQQQFQQADGVVDKTVTAISNPSLIANAVAESIPLMGAGAVPARAAMAIAPALGPVGAGAIGEGIVGAGSSAEQIRQETKGGTLTPAQAGLAAASGAATAGFGFAGGKVAQRLGIGDVETMLAQGAAAPAGKVSAKSIPRQMVEGAISEGWLEELPQSVSEQVLQNLALDKPWYEGVSDSAVMGTLAGMAMGGVGAGVGGFGGKRAGEAAAQVPPTNEPGQGQAPQGPGTPAVETPGLDAGKSAAEQSSVRAQQLADQEQVQPEVPQSAPPDGAAILAAQQAEQERLRQEALAQSRAVPSPDDEIYQSTGADQPQSEPPHRSLGIDPTSGPLSAAAATAVDSGVSSSLQQANLAAQEAGNAGNDQGTANSKKPAEKVPSSAVQALPTGITPAPVMKATNDLAGRSDEELRMGLRQAQAAGVRTAIIKELYRRRMAAKAESEKGAANAEQTGVSGKLDPQARQVAPAEPTGGNESAPVPQKPIPGGDLPSANQSPVGDAEALRPSSKDGVSVKSASLKDGLKKIRTDKAAKKAKEELANDNASKVQPSGAETAEQAPVTQAVDPATPPQGVPTSGGGALEASRLTRGLKWQKFGAETGTLSVPRAEMPQIKAEHRGAMVNFLKAKGIDATQEEVSAADLKPTQAEYSPPKVRKALAFKGGERSILASSDGHVLDGHHQWLSKIPGNQPVKVIRLGAPIKELLAMVKEFPSATQEAGATPSATPTNLSPQEKTNVPQADQTQQEEAQRPKEEPAGPASTAETKPVKVEQQSAPKPKPRKPQMDSISAVEKARADYFTPGNIIKGYGGFDEVLSYTPPKESGDSWSVRVHRVEKVDGKWVREGRPQDARIHATQPSSRELADGPVDRLEYQPAGDVAYSESRFDGAPHPNAEHRGVKPSDPAAIAPSNAGDADIEKSLDTASASAKSIQDVGEKIGGARKDVWSSFKDELNKVKDEDIKAEPLSKVWPAPSYDKLLEGGMAQDAVALVRSLRDEIPAKPRTAYKVQRWADQVKVMRDMANQLMEGTLSSAQLRSELEKGGSGLKSIAGRADLYEAVGHEKSLEGVRLTHHFYSLYKGKENVSLWAVERDAAATAFSNWPRELVTADTRDGAIEQFKQKYSSLQLGRSDAKEASFDIISQGSVKSYFIAKKIGRNFAKLAGPFPSIKEAREYRSNKQDELVKALEKFKEIPNERRDVNQPRVGEDMRNAQDVSPEFFAQTFGFRGVEFGNWVEQKRRQQDLNDAFDALMDMAAVLQIPPQAISLNGELGLAFGARGSGGVNPAAAHYESSKVVINLTKKQGAGSLGHEWWHALDNYFSRMRSQPNSMMTDARDVSLSARNATYEHRGEVRREMVDAFGAVMRSIKGTKMKERSSQLDAKRSKDYWGTDVEMSARAFEAYLISKLQDQNASNDYLANVVDERVWKVMADMGVEQSDSYPYPTDAEMAVVREGFDHFFNTIDSKSTDRGIALFNRQNLNTDLYSESSPELLDAMSNASSEFKSAENKRVLDVISPIAKAWKNPPPVVIAYDLKDHSLPDEIRLEDANQRTGGAVGAPKGFYFKGTVYLLSSQLSTDRDVVETLFHEALGHFGLRKAFGERLIPVLRQVWSMRNGESMAKLISYGMNPNSELDRLKAAEEVLAEMAQTRPEIGFVRRAVAAIRTWLRENVPALANVKLTDDEIVRSFLIPARNYVEGTSTPSARAIESISGITAVAQASRKGGNNTDLNRPSPSRGKVRTNDQIKAEFLQGNPVIELAGEEAPKGFQSLRNWASEIFKKAGGSATNPEIGTVVLDDRSVRDSIAHGMNRFKAEAFAAVPTVISRGVIVVERPHRHDATSFYISAPVKIAGVDDVVTVLVRRDPNTQRMYLHSVATKESLLNRRVSGTDKANSDVERSGPSNSGGESMVSQPTQVGKVNASEVADELQRLLSLDFGGFDSTPMASREAYSGAMQKARQELDKTFNVPGKLSWWHKTIGTMYNLAERSPEFKRVFDAAQGFVDDVSLFATEAADMAPKWLPKLETWRDITKSPVSAEDNKAVGRPIFEGTLNWARDESGKPRKVDELEAEAANLSIEQKAQRLLRNDHISPAMLRVWQGLPLAQYESLIESQYQAKLLQPGILWTVDELKTRWGLNGERQPDGSFNGQIGLYQEFRASVDHSLDSLAKAEMLRFGGEDVQGLKDAVLAAPDAAEAGRILFDYLAGAAKEQPGRASELLQLANGMTDRANKVEGLKKSGYAPLSRFGKYTVDVVTDGERQYFGLFETAREANLMAIKMRQEFGSAAVSQGTLSEQEFKLFAGITPESLEIFGNMLGLESTGDQAKDQAFQEYLRRTKTNRSALRRLIHRKGIAGYSEDVGRVLASFVYSNARQTAAALHMGELAQSINDIPKAQGELKDVAISLSEYIKNPQEEAQAIRGLLFAQYLGGSIASAFVNMTQPAAVSFPWLSQYAGAKMAGAELVRAMQGLATRKAYEPDLAKAIKEAEDDGTVSPQEVHQLMAQARGSGSLRPGDGTKVGDARAAVTNGLARMSLAWGKVFGAAEQVNRRSTFIAAYRIAKVKNLGNPAEFAKRAVLETQFVYSKANKMRWARGAVGGTLMTFKTYSIAYLELLHRMYTQGGPEGKRAAMLALAVLMLLGGAGGLPFAEDAEDVADALAQSLGYNFSSKKAKQEFLESIFGPVIGDFIDRGITGLPGAPLDISGRLGMGNLIPGTGLLLKKSNHTGDVQELAGPAGDLVKRGFTAAGQLLTGDVGSAALSMAPKAIANAAKGTDMLARGMYRDDKGYKVLDTSMLEGAMKAIGFQPASVSKVQEANYINQRSKDFYTLKAQEIRGVWARGIFEKDPDLVDQARQDLAAWNEANPDQRIPINMPSIMKRVREMSKSKDQRIADTAPKAMRAQMRADAAETRSRL